MRARFTDVEAPSGSDVCYATTNRQAGVRAIAARADALLVIGEEFSSNAQRLADVARASGCSAVQLVAASEAIDWPALSGARTLGLTAAASTPEHSIAEVVAALSERFALRIEEAPPVDEAATFRPLGFD